MVVLSDTTKAAGALLERSGRMKNDLEGLGLLQPKNAVRLYHLVDQSPDENGMVRRSPHRQEPRWLRSVGLIFNSY